MPRNKLQTLTEQMFYTLLCLREECYGMDILERIPAMTEGRVTIGSGTLYTLLEQFLDMEIIRQVRQEGRKRTYVLTDKGRQTLLDEKERMEKQLNDFEKNWKEGK